MNSENHALLIIDVQPTFCEGGALAVAGGTRVAQKIADFVTENAAEYQLIITTQDWHIDPGSHFSDNPDFIDSWPPHGIAGTDEAELHDEIAGLPLDFSVKKGQYSNGYSGFDGTTETGETLEEVLRAAEIQVVDIVGLAESHCVKYTALDALRAGWAVRVFSDLTVPVSAELGNAARIEMDEAGIEQLPSSEAFGFYEEPADQPIPGAETLTSSAGGTQTNPTRGFSFGRVDSWGEVDSWEDTDDYPDSTENSFPQNDRWAEDDSWNFDDAAWDDSDSGWNNTDHADYDGDNAENKNSSFSDDFSDDFSASTEPSLADVEAEIAAALGQAPAGRDQKIKRASQKVQASKTAAATPSQDLPKSDHTHAQSPEKFAAEFTDEFAGAEFADELSDEFAGADFALPDSFDLPDANRNALADFPDLADFDLDDFDLDLDEEIDFSDEVSDADFDFSNIDFRPGETR